VSPCTVVAKKGAADQRSKQGSSVRKSNEEKIKAYARITEKGDYGRQGIVDDQNNYTDPKRVGERGGKRKKKNYPSNDNRGRTQKGIERRRKNSRSPGEEKAIAGTKR